MGELFLATWWKIFFRIAVIPASIAFAVAIIPGGQFVTLLIALCLCYPATLVFGRSGFSPEFLVADSALGVWYVILFWALFAALVAVARVIYQFMHPEVEE